MEDYGGNGAEPMSGRLSLPESIKEKLLRRIYPATGANLTENSETEPIKILSSEDFGDPTMHEVLQWHISCCEWCKSMLDSPPPAFGMPDNRHCPEYYEIVQEYSDYERDYISKGNP